MYFPPPRRHPRIPLFRRRNVVISPAGLVYLFPDLFVKNALKGGFKTPCTGFYINMGQLFYLMLSSTYIFMNHNGVIKISLSEEGILSRRNVISVTKLTKYSPGIYGYLSRRLDDIRCGETARLYDLVVEDKKYINPGEYFVKKVFDYDLAGKGLFYGENPETPICRKIFEYKPAAERLSKIVAEFKMRRPKAYNTIMEEGRRILESMSKI